LLADLRAAGLSLTPTPDGRVNVTPRERLTPSLRGRILDNKPALLAALDLERRIRDMAQRWRYSPDDLTETLEAARQDPARWLTCVAADERLTSTLERAGVPFVPIA
jgi:hypothetical protein